MDLALNNLQRSICHESQQIKPNQYIQKTRMFKSVNLLSATCLKILTETKENFHWTLFTIVTFVCFGLVFFLFCLMAYQSSWVT